MSGLFQMMESGGVNSLSTLNLSMPALMEEQRMQPQTIRHFQAKGLLILPEMIILEKLAVSLCVYEMWHSF
jgi:hypothetical protein